MDWSKQANLTIFGMAVVDSFLLARGCQGRQGSVSSARLFFEELACDLIDNDYDARSLRKRQARAEEEDRALSGAPEVPLLHPSKQLTSPTPTKRRKASNPNHRFQGRCMECGASTSHVCRACQQRKPEADDKQYWICNKSGKVCMGKHILKSHPNLMR